MISLLSSWEEPGTESSRPTPKVLRILRTVFLVVFLMALEAPTAASLTSPRASLVASRATAATAPASVRKRARGLMYLGMPLKMASASCTTQVSRVGLRRPLERRQSTTKRWQFLRALSYSKKAPLPMRSMVVSTNW